MRKRGQVTQLREFFIDLWWLCHIRLKIAGEGMVFSVFLWDLFCWSLLYCDSCPLTVRITSPGTRSSSRAEELQANAFSLGL